ncbi:MAG: SDR family oxidoreductase, partial [Euryarchaeota archaeon]|nr:SDR family oxidoreductase [Euryarchaeota archaeon]
ESGVARRAVEGCDYIFHTAGLFDLSAPRERLWRANVESVEGLCRAVADGRGSLRALVHWSSASVYGDTGGSPVSEDFPARPGNLYEQSKWAGEDVARRHHREAGLPVRILRPTLVYGPRSRYGHAMFLATFAILRDRGPRRGIGFRGGPRGCNIHGADVARAALAVAGHKSAEGEAFNVTDESPLTMEEFLDTLMAPFHLMARTKIPIHPRLARFGLRLGPAERYINWRLKTRWGRLVEKHGLVGALRPRLERGWLHYLLGDHVYDGSRLRALGWRPRYPDLAGGIRDTVEWYQRERWLPAFPE